MAKNGVIPDVNDRTPNDPAVLLSSKEVLAIFNSTVLNVTDKAHRVTDHVQKYILDKAHEKGWSDKSHFVSKQCLLIANVVHRAAPTSN